MALTLDTHDRQPRQRRSRTAALAYALLAGMLTLSWLPFVGWGLPSRDADLYLFDGRTPWSGAELVALAGGLDTSRAADVTDAFKGDVFNATDADRARIAIRYRLYSQHPDEMLTLRAVASMAQRRSADPQFYTYGGLWTYPVAALIGVATAVGWIGRGDLAFYLDQPEEFAKMYLVARAYTFAWAVVGAVIVFQLVRRLTHVDVAAWASVVLLAATPVVQVTLLEAKPHLPAAVLVLATLAASCRHVRTPTRGSLPLAGVCAGMAASMVPTGAVAFLLLPVAAWLARDESRTACRLRRVTLAVAAGCVTYVVLNPFAVLNPAALTQNAFNTSSHYASPTPEGVLRAAVVLGDALLPALVFGIIAAAGLAGVRVRRDLWPVLVLCGVVVVPVTLVYLLTSQGRPDDHVRFALPAAVLGVTSLAVLAGNALRNAADRAVPMLIVAATLAVAASVVAGELLRVDALVTSRPGVAGVLRHLPGGRLSVPAEPAPYIVPPFDLWKWQATRDDAPTAVGRIDRFKIGWRDARFGVRWADDASPDELMPRRPAATSASPAS